MSLDPEHRRALGGEGGEGWGRRRRQIRKEAWNTKLQINVFYEQMQKFYTKL